MTRRPRTTTIVGSLVAVALVAVALTGGGGAAGVADAAAVDADDFEVTQTPANVTVAPGENVTFGVTVAATGLDGPGVALTTPEGWAVVAQEAPAAQYRATERQWLWLRGGQRELTYTLRVPKDAEAGAYRVAVNGSALTGQDTFVSERATTAVRVQPTPVAPTVERFSVPANTTVGGDLRVETALSNDRNRAGSRTVKFSRDGQVVAERTVAVAANTETVETVEFTPSTPGIHTVRVGETTESVTVTPRPAPTLRIDAPEDGTVERGSNGTNVGVKIRTTVGNLDGDRSLVWRVDDGEWRSSDEAVSFGGDGVASGTRSVSLTTPDLGAGEHTVAVGVRLANGSVVAVADRRVIVDTAAPTVTLELPETVGPESAREATARVDERTLREAIVSVRTDGETLTTRTETSALGDGTARLLLSELLPSESGQYTVAVTARDGVGRERTATQTVQVDATPPTLSELSATDVRRQAEKTYTDRWVGVTGAVADVDGAVENVTLVAQSVTGAHTETATVAVTDGSFAGRLDLRGAPEGPYTLRVRASDGFGNTATERVGRVTLDRAVPTLGVAVTAVSPTTGRVVVSTDEPLATPPTVTVEFPDGGTTTVTTRRVDGTYRGEFELTEDGRYGATVTASDRAGNRGQASSSTTVRTGVTVRDQTATIRAGDGTYVRLRLTTDEVDTALASLTASDAPLAALGGELNGTQFLTAELGDRLSDRLASAEIGIPRTEVTVPSGGDDSDLEIRRFDLTRSEWDAVGETSVERRTIGGETSEYFVVEVPGFSTYGAVVTDTAPPTVTSVETTPDPGSGDTLSYGTTRTTTTVEYTDDVSGVNTSNVSVRVDGQPVSAVTGATATVTADATTVEWRELAPGSHTIAVTVADEAGQTTTARSEFTIAGDETAPTLRSDFENGTVLPPRTTAHDVTVSWVDDESGVDTTTLQVTVDGSAVDPAALAVGPDGVTVTATGLSAGRHVLRVTVADAASNRRTLVREFSVGQDAVPPALDGVSFDPQPATRDPATFQPGEAVTVQVAFDDGLGGFDRVIRAAVGSDDSQRDVTGQTTVSSGVVRVPVSGPDPGENVSVVVNVTDAAGNHRTVTRTIRGAADQTAPTVQALTIAGESVGKSSTLAADVDSVAVTVDVRETGSGLSTASDLRVRGDDAQVIDQQVRDGQVTATLAGLDPGEKHTLVAQLRDAAGNTNTVTRTVSVAERDQQTATDTGEEGDNNVGGSASTEFETAELRTERVPAGGQIRVALTVRNDGSVSGTHTTLIRVDGNPLLRDVSVPAGDTVTRVVTVPALDNAGTVEILIGKQRESIGRVTVVESVTETTVPPTGSTPTPDTSEPPATTISPTPATSTPSVTPTLSASSTTSATPTLSATESPTRTSTSDTSTATPTETSTGLPGLGLLAGLVALAVLAVVAVRRR